MKKLLYLATTVGLVALLVVSPALADRGGNGGDPGGGPQGNSGNDPPPQAQGNDNNVNEAPAAALQGLVGQCVQICTVNGDCIKGTLEKVTGSGVEVLAPAPVTASCQDLFIFKDKIVLFTAATECCTPTP